MKLRPEDPRWIPEEDLRRPGVADAMAEALMLHHHRCFAVLVAEGHLDRLGMARATFLSRWAHGDFDA